MLNILKQLTDFLLRAEEKEAERCDIPDENIEEWEQLVKEHLAHLKANGGNHPYQIEQLEDILQTIQNIKTIRQEKCASPEPK